MSFRPTQTRSWTAIRGRVLKRDGYQCQLCGDVYPLDFDGALFVHHKIYRAHEGSDDPENLVTLCDLCHAVPHQYGKWLGFANMCQEEKQRARESLAESRQTYEWYLRLPQAKFLDVQNKMWSGWGIVKRMGTE